MPSKEHALKLINRSFYFHMPWKEDALKLIDQSLSVVILLRLCSWGSKSASRLPKIK